MAQLEFQRCNGATLTVSREQNSSWSVRLWRVSGKFPKSRVVTIAGCYGPLGEAPYIYRSADSSTAALWLAHSCINIPARMVPKLEAFLEEHGGGRTLLHEDDA